MYAASSMVVVARRCRRYRVATHATGTVPVKRHRGEPGHTRDTRAQTSTGKTQANLTTIQTHQNTRTTARRPNPGPNPRPAHGSTAHVNSRIMSRIPGAERAPRGRLLADSEEAALSEPDPAASRSQSASPRLLEGGMEGGRRNESARAADANRRVQRPAVAGMPTVACVWLCVWRPR